MKSLILMLGILLAAVTGNAQDDAKSTTNAASVEGTIFFSPIQSLKVELIGSQHIEFATVSDYNTAGGKQYNSHLRVSVTSTVPWVVSVNAISETFSSNTAGSSNMPVRIMTLRGWNTKTQFKPVQMSASQQMLLIATDNVIQTVHYVDVNLNPGWNYAGGNYSTTLLFTLSSQ